ncbi:MAG: endonuclease domain-containing protein [Sphingomonadales bacterium]|nr:endonuclease domain-containing protein [Sphingomonadales bacterium]
MVEKRLTRTARTLRSAMTEPEKLVWSRLRGGQIEGAKFVRQFPIGNAVADFACRNARLVIELDGGQHSRSATDAARTRMIEAHGYTVVRFWNNDAIENIEGVLETIAAQLAIARNR